MAETENKYFAVSVDQWDKISFHKTEEDAKKECLRGAEELLDYAIEIDDISVYKCQIHNAVYGVVLGKAVCKEKQLSEEEKEDYGSDLVLEKPELVELPQDNNWISVKEKLPEAYTHVLVYTIAAETISLFYDGEKFLFYPYTYGLEKITHWQPLPTKPIQ